MKQNLIFFSALTALWLSGCAGFFGPGPKSEQVSHRITQTQWWKANRHKAIHQPGKGYYIQQVGYFDENGKPLDENPSYEWLKTNQSVSANSSNKDEAVALDGNIFENIFNSSRDLVGAGVRNEIRARAYYKRGEGLFQQKKFAAAKSDFEAAMKTWPDSPLEEDSMFKIAECEFFNNQYSKAQDSYGELLKKYSNTRYLPPTSKRLFSIGQYWVQVHTKDPSWPITPNFFDSKRPRFDTYGNALNCFRTIIEKDPTSDLADISVMALGDAYFNQSNFMEADFFYTMLRRDYPHSKYQFQAHLRGMLTKLNLYQGIEYDDGPLIEAEKLADQLLTLFPKHIDKERTKVLKIKSQIVNKRAEKIWSLAEYYEQNKEYRSARMTYEKVVKDYPSTKYAQESGTRLASLKGKPIRAPHPLQWATKYIPGTDSDTRLARESQQGTRR